MSVKAGVLSHRLAFGGVRRKSVVYEKEDSNGGDVFSNVHAPNQTASIVIHRWLNLPCKVALRSRCSFADCQWTRLISDKNAMFITITDGPHFCCLTLEKDMEFPPSTKRGSMFPAFTSHHHCHDCQRADQRQQAVMGLLVRI